MKTCQTKAIVLKKKRLGEADGVIIFFTEKYGKLCFIVRGLYRLKSRYAGKLEPSLCTSLIFPWTEPTKLLRLASCDLLDSYRGIRGNPVKIFHAFYFLELIDAGIREKDPNPSVFHLLETALSLLVKMKTYETLTRIFELRLLALMGYAPKLSSCVHCGNLPAEGPLYFNFKKGGVLCSHCTGTKEAGPRISLGSINFAIKGMTIHDRQIGRLKIPRGLAAQIEFIAHNFLVSRVGREFKSYRFLNLQ